MKFNQKMHGWAKELGVSAAVAAHAECVRKHVRANSPCSPFYTSNLDLTCLYLASVDMNEPIPSWLFCNLLGWQQPQFRGLLKSIPKSDTWKSPLKDWKRTLEKIRLAYLLSLIFSDPHTDTMLERAEPLAFLVWRENTDRGTLADFKPSIHVAVAASVAIVASIGSINPQDTYWASVLVMPYVNMAKDKFAQLCSSPAVFRNLKVAVCKCRIVSARAKFR